MPGTALATAVLFYAEKMIAVQDLGGMMLRLFRYGSLFLAIVLQALFAFAIVLIMVEGLGIVAAITRSVRIATSNALGAFLLVAIPVLLHSPAALVLRRGPLLVQRASPEILGMITGADIVVGLLANYLILAGITRFYLAGRAAR